jgi:hypothetical protein
VPPVAQGCAGRPSHRLQRENVSGLGRRQEAAGCRVDGGREATGAALARAAAWEALNWPSSAKCCFMSVASTRSIMVLRMARSVGLARQGSGDLDGACSQELLPRSMGLLGVVRQTPRLV